MTTDARKPARTAASGIPRANRTEKMTIGSSARFTFRNIDIPTPHGLGDVDNLERGCARRVDLGQPARDAAPLPAKAHLRSASSRTIRRTIHRAVAVAEVAAAPVAAA